MATQVAIVGGEPTDMSTGEVLAQRAGNFGGLIRPLASAPELMDAQNENRALIASLLKEGRDFGVIPGTKEKSLYQAGAERVNGAFGVYARHRIIEQEVDHDRVVTWQKRKKVYNNATPTDKSYRMEIETGTSIGLYVYVVECELVHRATGTVVGQALASCSTMESKYVDRPQECQNTALQMGEKRAYVRVTRNTHGLSDEFTQDEDLIAGDRAGSSNGALANGDAWLDQPVKGKKPQGRSWRQMIETGDGRGFVRWAIGNAEYTSISAEQKRILTEMCEAAKAAETAGQGDAFSGGLVATADPGAEPFTRDQGIEFDTLILQLYPDKPERVEHYRAWLKSNPAPNRATVDKAIADAKARLEKKKAAAGLKAVANASEEVLRAAVTDIDEQFEQEEAARAKPKSAKELMFDDD